MPNPSNRADAVRIELLTLSTESAIFSPKYYNYDKAHANELAELAYTYLVECLTKSNKELKADMVFHGEAMNRTFESSYPSVNLHDEDFFKARNDMVRVYNRHSLIAYIAERLLSVVKADIGDKLEQLIAICDTPIFNVAFEYAENHERYFPGYVKAVDNIELVRHLDNRYLFSASRYFDSHRNL